MLWYERVSSPDHSGSSLGRGLDQSLKRKRERKRDELEAVHRSDISASFQSKSCLKNF